MDLDSLPQVRRTPRNSAQQRLMAEWLRMPKGEARERFFFEFVVNAESPEALLAKWESRQQQKGEAA